MYRGSTAINYLTHFYSQSDTGLNGNPLNFSGLDAPATTSSTAYTIKGTNTAGGIAAEIPYNVGSSLGAATFILEEIMG